MKKPRRRLAAVLTAAVLLLPGCAGTPAEPASGPGPETSIRTTAAGTAEASVLPSGGEETAGPSENDVTDAGSAASSAGRTGTQGTAAATAAPDGTMGAFSMKSPLHMEWAQTLKPAFSWTRAEGAESYTLVLERFQNGAYGKVREIPGIKGLTHTLAAPLEANELYRWKVYAVSGNRRAVADGDEAGRLLVSVFDAKNHSANKGLNFTFKNTVSEPVLRNYLSRSMILNYTENFGNMLENLRMILYTGAKYIARSGVVWQPGAWEQPLYDSHAFALELAHEYDPELVFEACIFETVWKSVEEIAIPAHVFRAFGQPAENRTFRYDRMIFTDGTYVNHWGTDGSVPDMTRLETQMFFYYRACLFIDQGYEALHMGQVHLIGAKDAGWTAWTKVLGMIRTYAKSNARRGFVFINAHTHGIMGSDGKLLFDFHSYPYRGVSPEGSTAHAPSQGNPQEIVLQAGFHDAIYGKSLGGTTYSGWSCASLPYFVELDNFGSDAAQVDKPTTAANPWFWWGVDEMGWFRRQPSDYRARWLRYAYSRVPALDSAGYAQMPGARFCVTASGEGTYYQGNHPDFLPGGLGDEETVRNIWIASRK